VNKASRSGGGGGGFGGGSRPAEQQPKVDDPWGSAPASGSFSGSDDEPPF
jgi:single-strand DNA-binding protein